MHNFYRNFLCVSLIIMFFCLIITFIKLMLLKNVNNDILKSVQKEEQFPTPLSKYTEQDIEKLTVGPFFLSESERKTSTGKYYAIEYEAEKHGVKDETDSITTQKHPQLIAKTATRKYYTLESKTEKYDFEYETDQMDTQTFFSKQSSVDLNNGNKHTIKLEPTTIVSDIYELRDENEPISIQTSFSKYPELERKTTTGKSYVSESVTEKHEIDPMFTEIYFTKHSEIEEETTTQKYYTLESETEKYDLEYETNQMDTQTYFSKQSSVDSNNVNKHKMKLEPTTISETEIYELRDENEPISIQTSFSKYPEPERKTTTGKSYASELVQEKHEIDPMFTEIYFTKHSEIEEETTTEKYYTLESETEKYDLEYETNQMDTQTYFSKQSSVEPITEIQERYSDKMNSITDYLNQPPHENYNLNNESEYIRNAYKNKEFDLNILESSSIKSTDKEIDIISTTQLDKTSSNDGSNLTENTVVLDNLDIKKLEEYPTTSTDYKLSTVNTTSFEWGREIENSKQTTTALHLKNDISSSKNATLFHTNTIIREKIVKNIPCSSPPKVCSTITCKKSASKIISFMDHEENPCMDFFIYACNGICEAASPRSLINMQILNKLKESTDKSPLEHKFKQLYSSCVHYDPRENNAILTKYLKSIFLNNTYNMVNKTTALTMLISNILLMGSIRSNSIQPLPLFDIDMEIDEQGYFIPVLTIPHQNKFYDDVFPDDEHKKTCLKNLDELKESQNMVGMLYSEYNNCLKNRTKYIFMLNKTLTTLNIFDHLKGFNKSQEISKAIFLVNLDVLDTLEYVSRRTKNILLHDESQFFYWDLYELQEQYSTINWQYLFKLIFKERHKVTKIKILFKEQLDTIFELYDELEFDDINSALLSMIAHDFYINMLNIENRCTESLRKNHCLSIAMNLMEDVAAEILLSTYDQKDIEYVDNTSNKIFEQIRDHLKHMIEMVKWLSNEQKRAAILQLEELKFISDVNNLYFNNQTIKLRNDKFKFSAIFMENLLAINENQRQLIYNKIDKNSGYRWLYNYNPLSKDAVTLVEQNTIVIPPAVIFEFTTKKHFQRNYELFAKLGYKISMAILEFFDLKRIKNVIPDIYSNEVFANFVTLHSFYSGIVNFENAFNLKLTSEDVDLSRNNIILANTALNLVFESYITNFAGRELPLPWLNFTVPQLFYMIFVQNNCDYQRNLPKTIVQLMENQKMPEYFYINVLLMNSHNFSDTFNCPISTPMNPITKIQPFPFL